MLLKGDLKIISKEKKLIKQNNSVVEIDTHMEVTRENFEEVLPIVE